MATKDEVLTALDDVEDPEPKEIQTRTIQNDASCPSDSLTMSPPTTN